MDELKKLNEAEQIYKTWYAKYRTLYMTPIENWDSFRTACKERDEDSVSLPLQPPTFLETCFLEDKFFFPDAEEDVAVISNARYCPAFWHKLSFFKILYVYSGSCWFYINDRKIQIKEGAFCIVGPNVRQAVFSDSDDDIIINLLMRKSSFTEAFASLLMEQGIVTEYLWRMIYNNTENFSLLYEGGKNATLHETVKEIYDELNRQGKKSNLICKSLLMIFFGIALREHADEIALFGITRMEKSYHIPKILTIMRMHMDTITLPALAEEFGLSEGYLSRYIKKETGHTFSYLLKEIRTKKAAQMLRNTKFSIDKILETIGYVDNSSFYRNFKEKYAMAPAQYRNRFGLM